jgi:hypothetical protein
VVLAAARDGDEALRLAALKALGDIAGADMVPDLIGLVKDARGRRELRAAEKALFSACAAGGDRDACSRAVAEAVRGAEGAHAGALVRTVGRLGAPSGLDALRAALGDAEQEIRDAAARALSSWPDPAAAPDVLALARASPVESHRVLAFRGYVRMAGLPGAGTVAERLRMYATAAEMADAAGRPGDKRIVIAGLAEVAHAGALEMMTEFLGEEGLRSEAAVAVVGAAKGMMAAEPGAARAAIRKVLDAAVDEEIKARARAVLDGAPGRD